MANPRGTFAKRNREMKLKDRAREKVERRAARKVDTGETKGPQIAWDQPGGLPPADAPDDNAADTPDGETE
jgi:hypothetical protein